MKESLGFCEFLEGYWAFLEKRNWSSMILHDWERIPHRIDSDIDYIVRGPNAQQLVHGLINYCEMHGWSLGQILEHEIDALYCVCFKNSPPFDSVLLDVCWDYRRKGIDLIKNEILFDGAWQPPGRSFNVPAPHAEFLYRLVKSAAKEKDLASLPDLEIKMRELFEERPQDCVNILAKIAGYHGGDDWNEVKTFFDGSAYFEKIRGGRKIAIRELKLYTKRILQPTGLLIGHDQGSPKIDGVVEVVQSAFRKVAKVRKGTPDWWVHSKLIKSTLVVRPGVLSRGKSGVFLSSKGENATEEGVKMVLEFLSSRIKKQWKYGR